MPRSYDDPMSLFESESGIPILQEVPIRPKGGFQYIYEFLDPLKFDDWRTDMYPWKQHGKVKFQHKGFDCLKFYFKVCIGVEYGKKKYSTDFSKNAYTTASRPNQVLVIYTGDEKVVAELPHGNAKHPSKIASPFIRSQPSLLAKLKSIQNKTPSQVYDELMLQVTPQINRHPAEVVRDMHQISNARKRARRQEQDAGNQTSQSSINRLVEFYHGLDFVRHLTLLPGLMVFCYMESAVQMFREQLGEGQDELTHCLSYDTCLRMGKLHLSVLSFRQTEFTGAPLVPVAYLIHELQQDTVHEFFFQQIQMLVPDLVEATNVIALTDDNPCVVIPFERHFPRIARFGCWLQALTRMKDHLRMMGIRDKVQLDEYKTDFIHLLNQPGELQYNRSLLDLVINWDKGAFQYFRQAIDPYMNKMGFWVLRGYGEHLVSPSPPGSLRNIFKKFRGWPNSTIDIMVLDLFHISLLFERRITRGRYQLQDEEDYVLQEHLLVKYNPDDPELVIPAGISIEDVVHRKQIYPSGSSSTHNRDISAVDAAAEAANGSNEEERATAIIEEDRIALVANRKEWIVTGASGVQYTIQLFQSNRFAPRCTCQSSTTMCCHVLAAMMTINYSPPTKNHPFSTLLRVKTSKASHRTYGGGRKRKKARKVAPANSSHEGGGVHCRVEGDDIVLVTDDIQVEWCCDQEGMADEESKTTEAAQVNI